MGDERRAHGGRSGHQSPEHQSPEHQSPEHQSPEHHADRRPRRWRRPGEADEHAAALAEALARAGGAERAVANLLAFVRRRITGDYTVDESGFDVDLTENFVAPLIRPIYRNYFRVETRGLENIPYIWRGRWSWPTIPARSRSMPPWPAVAVNDQHPRHRHLRMLGADVLFGLPFAGDLARRFGTVPACAADTDRLLADGHLVGVWPEGFKGVGKTFGDRYQLQRFGRGGFAAAALRAGAPIVPCSIVGAEEAYPMVGSSRLLGRLLGLPYFPITPTFPWLGALGPVPLPSKWLIEFGPPIETAARPARPRRRTRCWCSNSPTRSARRSSSRSTVC